MTRFVLWLVLGAAAVWVISWYWRANTAAETEARHGEMRVAFHDPFYDDIDSQQEAAP